MRRWAMICYACFRRWAAFTEADGTPQHVCPYCGDTHVHARAAS